jgi:trimethylguanosine synthase
MPVSKDFFQRYRLFSRYSEGCLLDEEGWFSVTPEAIANQIAERCRCGTIIDAFCGVGGNAIAFAKVCERGEYIIDVWRKGLDPEFCTILVIAIDNSATRLTLARHNAAVYGVADRIEFILGDFISFAKSLQHQSSRSLTTRRRPIDVVFLSPPWGGVDYLSMSPSKDTQIPMSTSIQAEKDPGMAHSKAGQEYSLANVSPLHGGELFQIAREITPNIAYFLPRNQDLEEVSALVTTGDGQMVGNYPHEIIEIEEEWMGTKLKALTCYFGGLAQGQEHLWDK